MSAQKRTTSGVLGGFLAFVGMSVAAGVLVTAAVTPAIAVSGMAATSGINMFENLPSYLEIGALAQKTNVYAVKNDGNPYLLASFFDQDHEEVSWDDISQYAKDAAVAGEDPRFYEHGGIDVQGTARAMISTYVLGGATQGGSSITQQYVKNVLVQKAEAAAKTEEEMQAAYAEATDPTPDRKLKEMRLAIGVEKKYSKDDILKGYLNIAGFGGRVYGIQSAAQYYFGGTSAKDLTLGQAAALLAIVNNPEKFRLDQPDSKTNGAKTKVGDKVVPYAKTQERRDYILDSMLKYKKITQKEHDAAIKEPIAPSIKEPSTGCATAGGAGFFCDYVYWTIANDPAFGETEDDRLKLLRQGGLDIYTTLDLDLQAAAEQAINETVPRSDPSIDVGASAVSVQPGTGRVLAMAQNKQFSNDPEVLSVDPQSSAVNFNTDFDYGGSSGFQPGSTYKIFTLGEWIKEGHSLNEYVNAYRRSDWGTFNDSCNGPISVPGWSPVNDEGGNGGSWTALYNTQNSENTGFVAMAKQLDLCGIRKTAESFGVHRADGDELQQGPASVLGTNEIAPVTMAEAFAGVAANGTVCKPIVIDKVMTQDGKSITPPSAGCAQSVDPKVTAAMAYAMQRVMSGGTGSSSNSRTYPQVPMIGKTGTTDDAEATWMSGASTKVATTVGVYNASGHVNLRQTYFNGVQAAVIRHEIWPRIMSVANAKYGGDAFPDADPSSLKTVTATVPDVRGKSIAEAQSLIEAAGFGFADGGAQDSELPAGQVTSTNPSGDAPRGSLVTAYTSNGSMVLMPNVVGLSEGDAKNQLKGSFSVKTVEVTVTDEKQNGIVQSSDPGAGAGVKPGSQVTISIGKFKDSKPGKG
ncbi:transglycosylase domain-containing protein [Leifsonia sp. Leaf264]|uniref:transglycosylase domain-containing protein n=1 Tax=Leifsonia sp. Leaf264 TaxID=1736314 RepID=UPI000A8F4800|nr:transglycosylase domain-containing protein [Leifsonia sp. Leaf264]